ncbi:tape measure protein [Acinetobacter lwoffii]|uniref:tape measure protein n=1 Tax=Acinetobacter lwoffii TaxID=28090 RepID=UPI0020975A12|nr:tape measure protein [Acinetobacter lwoffii]MCO8082005.1 tape measure protein [Acinetobacter lwoffii]
MSGKNLTFKLILDGDSKGLVQNAKSAEKAFSDLQQAIKQGTASFEGEAKKTSDAVSKIVPKESLELADKLKATLNSATEAIKGAGDGAKETADNFKDFGSKAEKAIDLLKADLVTAKQALQDFSKTNASPHDIDAAQQKVNLLENEVEQAEVAFKEFDSAVNKANVELKETGSAADKAKQGFGTIKAAIGTLAAGLAGLGLGLTVKELLQTADATQQMGERIKNATSSTEEYNMVQARLLELANKTFRPLEEAQEVYLATSGTMKSLGYSTEQILTVTESLSLSFTHNATRADQAASAQDALAKSMAKGSVDADAWMSIITGADNVVKDMAESTGRTEEEIRQLGASGKVSIKELTTALIESRDRNEELAGSMANSTADAMVALKNNLTSVIGAMNEKHQVSARLSEAMLTLGGDMEWLTILFDDAIGAVESIADRYSGLGTETEALKGALGSLYSLFKELISGAWELGKTVDDILGTAFKTFTSLLGSLTGNATSAGEQVSFLTRVLQGLSIVFGMVEDGVSGIKIGLSLVTGAFYGLAAAANSVMAALTWGDVSKQFADTADLMKEKSRQYYAEADKEAMEFNSKYIQRLNEAAKTEQQKNQEKADNAKATLDKIDADESASAQKRIKAAEDYAQAAIAANDGVLSKQIEAELAAKGYAVAMDEAGSVTVSALDEAGKKLTEAQQKTEAVKVATENLRLADQEYLTFQKQAAIERAALEQKIQQAKASGDLNELKQAQDKIKQIDAKEQELQANRNQRQTELLALNQRTATGSAAAYTRASELAQKFGIDLDKSLNKVSEQFTKSGEDIDKLGGELEELGITGNQAGDIIYQAWLKWLSAAENQAEIDAANAKLREFEAQGVFSTKQVELGIMAIRKANAELPDELDETGRAFERLGIKTKEQLRLAAQQAVMDYNAIKNSGLATAEGIEQAHKKAAQAVALSGDAGVIAAFNAADATQKLKVQIDETGKASVEAGDKANDSLHSMRQSTDRVRDGVKGIEGSVHSATRAIDGAKSSTEEWADAVNKAKGEFDKAMKQQSKALGSLDNYDSYNKNDVISMLKSQGYDDKDAKKLAGNIWSQAMEADRDAKMASYGNSGVGGLDTLMRQMYDDAAAKGITTQHGTNKINELLRSINVASTGSSNLNDYAPSIPSAPSVRDIDSTPKTTIRIEAGNGQYVDAQVNADQVNPLTQILKQLGTLKGST